MVFLSNVWMNFLGKELSSLFTYHYGRGGGKGRTEGSFLQPEVFMILTWTGGEVYLWHFTHCCHVAALWLWNTERWGREVLRATQLESIRPNSRVVEDSDHQRCHALSLRQWLWTFRRNVVLLSLWIDESTKNSKQPPSQRELMIWGAMYYHWYTVT